MRPIYLLLLFGTILSITASAQCYPLRHSTIAADSWVSCETSTNPNQELGTTHWIQYDLLMSRDIDTIHVWNVNTPSRPNESIKRLRVDYSDDGQSWTSAGEYRLSHPQQEDFYEGEDLSLSESISARYVLLTAIETFGSTCAGLAEVRFAINGFTTSTDDPDLIASKVVISPNPATSYINITIKDNSYRPNHVELYDAKGALAYSSAYSPRITLPQLTDGQYILHLIGDSQRSTHPLTIIKE